jgi:hypothetical protein
VGVHGAGRHADGASRQGTQEPALVATVSTPRPA